MSDWHEYDPGINEWTALTSYPGLPCKDAVAASYDGFIYLGFGETGEDEAAHWYAYDVSGNSWAAKAAPSMDFRTNAVAAAVGGKVYVGLGVISTTYYDDWHAYDIDTNTWSAKESFPGEARRNAIAVELGGKIYVGSGYGTPGEVGTFFLDWYEYDPDADEWTEVESLPVVGENRVAAALAGRIYAGTGTNSFGSAGDWHVYCPPAGGA